MVHRGPLRVVCNLGPDPQPVPLDASVESVLLASWPGSVAPHGSALQVPSDAVAVVRMAGSSA